MFTPTKARTATRQSSAHLQERNILAIAIFDHSGILEGCEVSNIDPSGDWTSAAFHTIGLKKLLTASLKNQNFEYAKVRSQGCTTFILRRRHRYVALVSRPLDCNQEANLAQLLRSLPLMELIGLVRSPELAPIS